MIIEPKNATIAYRCPRCGSVPTSYVDLFTLSGDLFKLKCDCGESELSVHKLPDSKFRLTVPCIACVHPHTFDISYQVLFNSDIFVIPCSLCGLDICFLGKSELVSKEIKRSNDEIAKMLGDYALSSLKSEKEEKEALADPAVLDIVSYVVQDMAEEGVIYCDCEHGHGDYLCEITDSGVTVSCKNCGAMARVPAESTIAAYEFLNSDSLTLKQPKNDK